MCPMGSNEGFSTRLRAAREAKGMEIIMLAAITGISPKTLGRWETGETTGSVTDVALVADALDVSLDYLAGVGNGNPV